MSVSSQASEPSISEGETAYSSVSGSGVATPVAKPNPETIESPPTKPRNYLPQDGAAAPPTERSPLLARRTSTTERNGHARLDEQAREKEWTWWDEFKTLSSYVLPVYGYVLCLARIDLRRSPYRSRDRTHLLEYSLNIASVVSIGHISTVALAACSLGNMTASVTGFSIVQGFASALDTLLPSAWTSGNPRLVGLWLQRMLVLVTLLTFVSLLLRLVKMMGG